MSIYRQAAERQRELIADIPLTIRERIVLLVLPLFFLVPAAAVPSVFVYDLLTRRFPLEDWELWAFVVGPLVVATLFGLVLVWLVRGFDLRQRVYDDGYEVRFRRRTVSIAFDDVLQLVDDSRFLGRRQPESPHQERLVPSFALELGGGDSRSLLRDGSFHGLSWNHGRAQKLYDALARAYGDHLGMRQLEAIGRGERCTYGPITADREGLDLDGRRVPWRDVTYMGREGGGSTQFSIVFETAGSERWSAPADEIPDHPALRVVCATLAGR